MQNIKRRVRTAHRGSREHYESTPDERTLGEGQGKASSLGTWLLVSCSLLDTLRRYTPGVRLDSADRAIIHKRIADLYVDDNDLPITSQWRDRTDEIERVTDNLQKASQAWERLLFGSGGGGGGPPPAMVWGG